MFLCERVCSSMCMCVLVCDCMSRVRVEEGVRQGGIGVKCRRGDGRQSEGGGGRKEMG